MQCAGDLILGDSERSSSALQLRGTNKIDMQADIGPSISFARHRLRLPCDSGDAGAHCQAVDDTFGITYRVCKNILCSVVLSYAQFL